MGDISVDTAARSVAVKGTAAVLTKKEYAVLEYQMRHKGNVVSAEELIEHVWDSEADLFSNSFKYHIYSLKKKLDAAGEAGGYIRNLRGQGYKIECPDSSGNEKE